MGLVNVYSIIYIVTVNNMTQTFFILTHKQ